LLPCHQYQRSKAALFVEQGLTQVLNACSKEDPGKLGETFNATNLDICDFDIQEQISLYSIPNFVQASVLDMPFANKSYKLVVLGEFLEHCSFAAAKAALLEVHRVLSDDGRVVVTVPLDPRPKHVQHLPHQLVTYVDAGEVVITSWHTAIWNPPEWNLLLAQSEFVELPEHRQELQYGFCSGFGAVLRKAGKI
jgi:hypothetical protein